MSLNRAGWWLAAWLVVLTAATSVSAQNQGVQDMQLFAPADFDGFGGGTRANEGVYFNFNGLYWTISAPATTSFGLPGPENARVVNWGDRLTFLSPELDDAFTATQGSTMDTGYMGSEFSGGTEISLGYQWKHEGIRFHYFRLHGVSQRDTQENITAFFDDRIWGAGGFRHTEGIVGETTTAAGLDVTDIGFLPVQFDSVEMFNRTKVWGLDAGYVIRQHPSHNGGIWEWTLGARYIEFREWFDIYALGGLFGDTTIFTSADNRMVGPELRLRWFQRRSRWTLSTEAGFTAAANFQSVRQDGQFATSLGNAFGVRGPGEPLAQRALGFTHNEHFEEFSPIVDFRVQLKYNLTRAMAATVGWSGMWIDNVARPASMIDYTLYEATVFGLMENNNRQDTFMQGLVAGVEFNY